METTERSLSGEVFIQQMKLPRSERFAYLKEYMKTPKILWDDSGKHKGMMCSFVKGKLKRYPTIHANQNDRLI